MIEEQKKELLLNRIANGIKTLNTLNNTMRDLQKQFNVLKTLVKEP